jgi:hypothetical protein
MPDFLTSTFAHPVQLPMVLLRLVLAGLLGLAVAWIYRRTRASRDISPTFPGTLVLLAILIAMVTQVIGDSVARAFSLVGSLSIVRFRTVVRDTQDTAFVIFAVAVGMAIGTSDLWVATAGLVVIGAAAYYMRPRAHPGVALPGEPLPYFIRLRTGLGGDLDADVARTLDEHVTERRLQAIETAKHGISIDVTYEVALRAGVAPEKLVKALNRIEGMQSVQVERRASPDREF